MARIEYPITVKAIGFDDRPPIEPGLRKDAVGKFVAIRPVSDICPEKKTYLGLYIGEVPIWPMVKYDEQDQSLTFSPGHGNPAMYVFDLNRVVLGCESWWAIIKSEGDLEQITDEDIQNIWYVRAIEAIYEQGDEP